ncbi:FKBP-type peptidyl-prolyl cis-trans isomerase [Aliikangiella sp. G2MR2-5]|uniref:FKBP-type peptidyl-prolyl cis-trans isomerase n=1 Tax=Aliikangiella sp. G2MR2-5 TaxID=2788943 RepID=UPI0018AB8144|nr:FKBP-type peptidyl-prolyl cis-trans isomerase [Aliikangiella sp. G2MR2-5]
MESNVDKVILAVLLIVAIAYFFYKNQGSSEQADKNRQVGAAFLAENKTKDGVVETASGLQYLVLRKGEGSVNPKASDRVKVHYHGTLIDGSVFDSSVERGAPLSFGLNQVIKGWTEGVQLMAVGDKTRFFIPADLAYGNRKAGKIEPGSTLIFDIELLAINE